MDDYTALDPFFDVIRQGLLGQVDGAHFFDFFAEDAVTEYVVTVPGYPRRIDSRAALMELYRPYGDSIRLSRGDDLRVYRDPQQHVTVLEYRVQGTLVATGAPYENRFVSIITVQQGKITHWRDYLDSFAAVSALSG
ncbi:nuclear transport factor 2 family protein [Kutzneria chonburiensis]|uniref:Nuclear transport factor 2 family protein n=1 Tax=Kutzneria chonburiensis TaxID=1483604 RepID=A0ABV6MSV2_9PSEU|nr:nuclear transport factor 2 family protein [Kutzneria chonburiensis]